MPRASSPTKKREKSGGSTKALAYEGTPHPPQAVPLLPLEKAKIEMLPKERRGGNYDCPVGQVMMLARRAVMIRSRSDERLCRV